MLWGLIVLLCAIWLVAVLLKATIGGLIHLLLVVAVVVLIYRLITGKKAPLP